MKMKKRKTCKTKRFINFLKWVLLLPAALLGIYAIVLGLGILPEELPFGENKIVFNKLGETVLNNVFSVVCFGLCPVAWALVMIIDKVRRKKSADGAGVGASKPEKPQREKKKNRRKNKRSGNIGNEGIIGDGDSPPIDADGEDYRDFTNLRELEGWSKINGGQADASVYEPISLDGVVNDFRAFAESHGMDIPEKTAREWLSAIASGRVIAIEGEQSAQGRKVVGIFAKYFGGSVNPYDVKNPVNAGNLLFHAVPNKDVEATGFLTDIYTACLDRNSVRFAYLYKVGTNSISLFSNYKSAFERDSGGAYLPLNFDASINGLEYIKDGKVFLPENLILVLEPINGLKVATFTNEVTFLSLDGVGECECKSYFGTFLGTSRSQLQKALGRARSDEKYRISDELWKKLDGIEERLGKYITGYRFDNRRVRLMERYFVAYRALGGNESEAIGSMLSACLFASLYSNNREAFPGNGDNEGLASFIKDEFGAENMGKAIDIVNALCGVVIEESEKLSDAEDGKDIEAEEIEEAEESEAINEIDEIVGFNGTSFGFDESFDNDLT